MTHKQLRVQSLNVCHKRLKHEQDDTNQRFQLKTHLHMKLFKQIEKDEQTIGKSSKQANDSAATMNVVTFLDCEANEHCFHVNVFIFPLIQSEKTSVFFNVRNGSHIHAFANFHFLLRGGVRRLNKSYC